MGRSGRGTRQPMVRLYHGGRGRASPGRWKRLSGSPRLRRIRLRAALRSVECGRLGGRRGLVRPGRRTIERREGKKSQGRALREKRGRQLFGGCVPRAGRDEHRGKGEGEAERQARRGTFRWGETLSCRGRLPPDSGLETGRKAMLRSRIRSVEGGHERGAKGRWSFRALLFGGLRTLREERAAGGLNVSQSRRGRPRPGGGCPPQFARRSWWSSSGAARCRARPDRP